MKGIDVVQQSIYAIKNHPKLLLPQLVLLVVAGLSAFALIVPLVLQLGLAQNSTAMPTPQVAAQTIVQLIPNFIILILIALVVGMFVIGIYADAATKLNKPEISLQDTFSVSASRFIDLMLYSILITVIEIAVFGLIFSPSISTIIKFLQSGGVVPSQAAITSFVVGLLGSILVSIVLVIIGAPLLFATIPLIVIERKGPIQALKASISIGRKDFLGILGVFFIFLLFYCVADTISIILRHIPFIGFIFSLAVSVFIGAVGALLAPIYYTNFVIAQKPIQKTKTVITKQKKK